MYLESLRSLIVGNRWMQESFNGLLEQYEFFRAQIYLSGLAVTSIYGIEAGYTNTFASPRGWSRPPYRGASRLIWELNDFIRKWAFYQIARSTTE